MLAAKIHVLQLKESQYALDRRTKKLTYEISDWVAECSGAVCEDGAVYATNDYEFLCLPRNITERLAAALYTFEDADAWLDLWCHTVWNDPRNAFSFLTPAIQYRFAGAVLSLETLGQRWGWEKTKVWRFFQKHGDAFALYRLPGSYVLFWIDAGSKSVPISEKYLLTLEEAAAYFNVGEKQLSRVRCVGASLTSWARLAILRPIELSFS